MDRVRMLSLTCASEAAFDDHLRIFEALRARDPDRAVQTMGVDLGPIPQQIEPIRDGHRELFEGV